MLAFSPLDEDEFDKYQIKMGYLKLFPYILEDFLTRKDSKKMMQSSNLPVSTNVTVNPGQAVSAPPPSGVGSTTSPGTGDGTGNTNPTYDGSSASAASLNLKQQYKSDLESGKVEGEKFTADIKASAGEI